MTTENSKLNKQDFKYLSRVSKQALSWIKKYGGAQKFGRTSWYPFGDEKRTRFISEVSVKSLIFRGLIEESCITLKYSSGNFTKRIIVKALETKKEIEKP